jgi:hypothetical protein
MPSCSNLKDQPYGFRSVLVIEGSDSVTCPEAHNTPPVRRALRCRHVTYSIEHATHQERASVSSRAQRHHACHPSGEGSGVTTYPEAPIPSPGSRRLWSHHMPHGSRPATYAGRLWCHHVTEAPGPPPGRASVPPRVLWLQTRLLVWEGSGAATCLVALGPGAYLCVPKTHDIRSIMASPITWCRQCIKCVCDRPYAAYGRD